MLKYEIIAWLNQFDDNHYFGLSDLMKMFGERF
jgi:hypothetical protein